MARDLRAFIKLVEERGQLRRIKALVDSDLEIAEIANRMLQVGGPALLFENVRGLPFRWLSICWGQWSASVGR